MKHSSHPPQWIALALAVATPFLWSSCDTGSQQAALAAQADAEALQRAKVKLEGEVKQVREAAEQREAELIKRSEELQKEADAAKSQFEKLQDDAAKARKELEEYMAKYKVGARAKLKGEVLDELRTSDTQAYRSVVVSEVTPTEVSFAHSDGVARVPLAELASELQKKFLYDPEDVQRQEEAQAVAVGAVEGLDGIEGIDVPVVQKDPTRSVNPIVIHNLKSRIQARQQEIEKAKAEASRVKRAGDDQTNLGKYRLQVLSQRAERMREEIRALANMLNKELNG